MSSGGERKAAPGVRSKGIVDLCDEILDKQRSGRKFNPDVKRAILQLRVTADRSIGAMDRAKKQAIKDMNTKMGADLLAEVESLDRPITGMVMCDVARLFEIMVLVRLSTGVRQYGKEKGAVFDIEKCYGADKKFQPWQAALKLFANCPEWHNKVGEEKCKQLGEIMSLLTMARCVPFLVKISAFC